MTEAEWLAATDPKPMVKVLREKEGNRKFRLFLVASARLIWDRIPAGEMRQAVEAAEQHADDMVTAEAIKGYYDGFYRFALTTATPEDAEWFRTPGNSMILTFVRMATYPDSFFRTLTSNDNWTKAIKAHHPSLPPLLRDIFGNPFRPILLDAGWRTDTVTAIAKQVYDSRDFSAMPILADALQDAGCSNEEVLNHCRFGGVHVRGCWVVDAVLGRQ